MTIDDAAATELTRRRREGRRGPRLDPALRPITVTEALALQHRVATRLGTIGGWKCSLPKEDRITVAPLFSGALADLRFISPDDQALTRCDFFFVSAIAPTKELFAPYYPRARILDSTEVLLQSTVPTPDGLGLAAELRVRR